MLFGLGSALSSALPGGPQLRGTIQVAQHFRVAGDAECARAERPPPHARGAAAETKPGSPAAGDAAPGGACLIAPPLPAPAGMGVWSQASTVASSFASRSRESSEARSRFSRGPGPAHRRISPQPASPENVLTLSSNALDLSALSRDRSFHHPLLLAGEQRRETCGTTTR